MARLKDTYKQEIVPAMMKKFNYKNIMQVPKLEKVVINMGMGCLLYTSDAADE